MTYKQAKRCICDEEPSPPPSSEPREEPGSSPRDDPRSEPSSEPRKEPGSSPRNAPRSEPIASTGISEEEQQQSHFPLKEHLDHHHPTMKKQPKKIQDLELWHQRMGHISPGTLIATQQCTEGIPQLPRASSLFKCPYHQLIYLRPH